MIDPIPTATLADEHRAIVKVIPRIAAVADDLDEKMCLKKNGLQDENQSNLEERLIATPDAL